MTSPRITLCNEVLRDLPFEVQCVAAAELGYDAIELAPFTLSKDPHRLSGTEITRIRAAVEGAGIAVSGLHMLMREPPGLSISADDDLVAERTREVGKGLVALCSELGGRYLVHGSARQRNLRAGEESADRSRALSYFEAMALAAQDAEVVYCIEALSPDLTNFITSIAEAIEIVDAIGARALRTMLDCAHAARFERDDICTLLRRHVGTGHVAHIHANEPDGRRPGSGKLDFINILRTLRDIGYRGDIGVEPFIYEPDGHKCAEDAIRYLKSCMD